LQHGVMLSEHRDDHGGIIIAPGQMPTLTFSNSGGGTYRVRFKVASP
jgi:hypothetical protein